jgi:hypothetical protein
MSYMSGGAEDPENDQMRSSVLVSEIGSKSDSQSDSSLQLMHLIQQILLSSLFFHYYPHFTLSFILFSKMCAVSYFTIMQLHMHSTVSGGDERAVSEVSPVL